MSHQLTFADSEFSTKRRQTRKEIFLSRMEQILPWQNMTAVIEPFYPKAGNGRRPYPLETMLRIHCMQHWYNLSDGAMEDALYEIASMRLFARLSLDSALPDRTTIMNFRHLLEQHQLARQLFKTINRWLAEAGVMMTQGTLVDATIIEAPSSTKNKEQQRDPEMHQTKKGNQWHFGMKAHIGVDAKSGLTHSLVTTAANEHDLNQLGNTDHSVAKQKFRITNWSTYNKALINRGSLTFWLDDEAIQAWYESATPSSRGRPQRYSDLAITTVLVIKRVFRLTLRAAQGFIDSIFALMNVPLRCPDYTSVSKRAKSVNVSFKTSTRGEIAHLVIDSTGLKVFGEGEWKVRKHGKERRRIWRKLHLAVDSNTHEVVCADLSLNNVTDSEAFPGLIRQTHRKIRAAAADGAYDTRLCYDELRRKKISALIPPRKGAGYWPGEYADRNRAVANQRLSGSNARWKWTTEYNRRSIAETAMYRMKQLLGDSLTLRDYDGQVAEAMAMVRALNRMTKAGMPESVRIA
ncbi:IS5 family transposase [Escherichia coli]|nr:IS5 family transposase [Salmonella enterica]ECA1370553.1 IS5 family transposase [Salmonella enterica subsp. enterica serovar Idikan]ECF7164093.1 IS5 family transposase [Salmonella enterica subsp. enterica]EFL2363273.1 IS5 family transposase [Escherichia coli]EAY4843735.1 IS5 family transposase [Salmonella enterica]